MNRIRVARALALEVSFSANAGGRALERTAEIARRTMDLAKRVNEPQTIGLADLTGGIAYYLEGTRTAHGRIASAPRE